VSHHAKTDRRAAAAIKRRNPLAEKNRFEIEYARKHHRFNRSSPRVPD
jgi:hypothetical protein